MHSNNLPLRARRSRLSAIACTFALLFIDLSAHTGSAQSPSYDAGDNQKPSAAEAPRAYHQAQDDERPPQRQSRIGRGPRPDIKNTLTINPVGIVLANELALEYERTLADSVAVYLTPQYAWVDDGDTSLKSAGGEVGIRLFFGWEAPSGVWLGLQGGAAAFWGTEPKGDVNGAAWMAGALVGYTALLGHFVVSTGIGARLIQVQLETTDGPKAISIPGLQLRLAIGLGI